MDMSSAAFMSYVRFDDQHNGGQLTNLRMLLSGEVRAVTGRKFHIFQDTSDIGAGQEWKGEICAGIDECALFMPIITPSFFTSDACRFELERIVAREFQLDRTDLILPIYYITCPELENNPACADDPLVKVIAQRDYFDLRDLRGRPRRSLLSPRLTELAMQVVAGIERNRAMKRRGIFTHEALASSAHGAAAPAPAAANAAAKWGLPAGGDDQAAADHLECWKRIRRFLTAVEGMQKDV